MLVGILVFLARLIDVSLGTIRLKSMMRGERLLTVIIAFFEVFVYSMAAARAFEQIDKPFILIMYSFGYAAGNYLGILLDEKLSKQNMMMLIISDRDQWRLADKLRNHGFAVTASEGYGLNNSKKSQLFVIVEKDNSEKLLNILEGYDENVYTAVLDVRSAASMGMLSVRK